MKNYTVFSVVAIMCMYSIVVAAAAVPGLTGANLNREHDKDTLEWCRVIHSSPEPDLLFYNRIPKCASSTMKELFHNIARRRSNVIAYDLGSKFWSNHPSPSLQLDIYRDVNNHIDNPNMRLVFNGHIGHFPFNSSTIKYNKTIEHTQVVRDCAARETSQFFYLHDPATTSKKSRQSPHLQHGTAKESDVAPCVKSEECIMKQIQPDAKSELISTFMGDCSESGYRCHESSRAAEAVWQNIQPSGTYKTFGMSEHLLEYLEMLECVYPTLLRGIVKLYREKHHMVNVQNKTNYDASAVKTVTKLAALKCMNSSDDFIYNNVINETFWRRHAALKASPRRCCRGSHGIA